MVLVKLSKLFKSSDLFTCGSKLILLSYFLVHSLIVSGFFYKSRYISLVCFVCLFCIQLKPESSPVSFGIGKIGSSEFEILGSSKPNARDIK